MQSIKSLIERTEMAISSLLSEKNSLYVPLLGGQLPPRKPDVVLIGDSIFLTDQGKQQYLKLQKLLTVPDKELTDEQRFEIAYLKDKLHYDNLSDAEKIVFDFIGTQPPNNCNHLKTELSRLRNLLKIPHKYCYK